MSEYALDWFGLEAKDKLLLEQLGLLRKSVEARDEAILSELKAIHKELVLMNNTLKRSVTTIPSPS